MKKVLILIFASTLILSCQNHGTKVEKSDTKATANEQMHKNSFEDLVKKFESEDRDSWQKPDEIVAMLGDLHGKTIIDIGCGTGYFAFRLADAGAQVICADVDDRFLGYVEKKKTKKGIDNKSLSTKKIPYDSPDMDHTMVDKAIIVNTYHHIENRVDYFKLVKRGLKANSEVIVIDFKKEGDFEIGPPKEMRISSETIIKEMKDVGLAKYTIDTTTLPYQYILRFSEDMDAEFVSPD